MLFDYSNKFRYCELPVPNIAERITCDSPGNASSTKWEVLSYTKNWIEIPVHSDLRRSQQD